MGAIALTGALNHEPELYRVGACLRQHLAPGACLLAAVDGRMSPWRWLQAPFTGRVEAALRRVVAGRGSLAPDDPSGAIEYFFPDEFSRALGPGFRTLEVTPMNWLAPPLDVRRPGVAGQLMAKALDEAERRFKVSGRAQWLGERFLIALERLR